jgi:hypothetical protein
LVKGCTGGAAYLMKSPFSMELSQVLSKKCRNAFPQLFGEVAEVGDGGKRHSWPFSANAGCSEST